MPLTNNGGSRLANKKTLLFICQFTPGLLRTLRRLLLSAVWLPQLVARSSRRRYFVPWAALQQRKNTPPHSPGHFNTLVASRGWQLRRQHPFSSTSRRPRGLAATTCAPHRAHATQPCATHSLALLLRTACANSLFAHPGGAHSFFATAFACSARGSFPCLRGQGPRPWPLRSAPTCFRFRSGPVCGNNIGAIHACRASVRPSLIVVSTRYGFR